MSAAVHLPPPHGHPSEKYAHPTPSRSPHLSILTFHARRQQAPLDTPRKSSLRQIRQCKSEAILQPTEHDDPIILPHTITPTTANTRVYQRSVSTALHNSFPRHFPRNVGEGFGRQQARATVPGTRHTVQRLRSTHYPRKRQQRGVQAAAERQYPRSPRSRRVWLSLVLRSELERRRGAVLWQRQVCIHLLALLSGGRIRLRYSARSRTGEAFEPSHANYETQRTKRRS
jgi:hypothetical protein